MQNKDFDPGNAEVKKRPYSDDFNLAGIFIKVTRKVVLYKFHQNRSKAIQISKNNSICIKSRQKNMAKRPLCHTNFQRYQEKQYKSKKNLIFV